MTVTNTWRCGRQYLKPQWPMCDATTAPSAAHLVRGYKATTGTNGHFYGSATCWIVTQAKYGDIVRYNSEIPSAVWRVSLTPANPHV